jgi:Domain of unknown function (DUF5615)
MLKLASDADFNGDILKGLLRKCPGLDLVRVQDAGLRTASDANILDWTAAESRLLLTHDRTTMPEFAYERVRGGQLMPGVLVVRNKPPFGPVIEDLHLVIECTIPEEWHDRVDYLPF